jgi:transcriptional regulator with XRE-family HTH domain
VAIKRKSVVGAALRELRLAAGKTSADVEELLDCSQAKVSRIEKGRVGIKRAELLAMLDLYGASEGQRAIVLEKWTEASVRSKAVQSLSDLPPKLRALIRQQSEASVISCLQPLVIPGMLQAEGYARAIHEADGFVADDDVERAVAARMKRGELLLKDDGPLFRAVVSEGVLRDVIGSPRVMIEQLEHLLQISQRANVDFQVHPHTAGAYGTMSGPLTILQFPDPEDAPSVYLEYPAGGEWVEDPNSVGVFIAVFDGASRESLSASETTEWISARIAELKTM